MWILCFSFLLSWPVHFIASFLSTSSMSCLCSLCPILPSPSLCSSFLPVPLALLVQTTIVSFPPVLISCLVSFALSTCSFFLTCLLPNIPLSLLPVVIPPFHLVPLLSFVFFLISLSSLSFIYPVELVCPLFYSFYSLSYKAANGERKSSLTSNILIVFILVQPPFHALFLFCLASIPFFFL